MLRRRRVGEGQKQGGQALTLLLSAQVTAYVSVLKYSQEEKEVVTKMSNQIIMASAGERDARNFS